MGGKLVSDTERDMLSLPGRFGGLAIDNPVTTCDIRFSVSSEYSKALSDSIVKQNKIASIFPQHQKDLRKNMKLQHETTYRESAGRLLNALSEERSRAFKTAQEKGASALVTTLPIKRHGFSLSKTEFRDQILLRYHWPIQDLPLTCPCGKAFSVDHSQICHVGGFINLRHNEIRNIIANEMKITFKDVEIKPHLQPITGERLHPQTAITSNEARSDIRARGFWTNMQNAFFDISWVFYPHASSYLTKTLPALFKKFENEKKREYGDRIVNIEQGSFTPLIFSSTGGMGNEASRVLKKLAIQVAEKTNQHYSHVMGLLRCRISFGLMRCANICLRGSRRWNRPFTQCDSPADVVIQECQIVC